MQSRARLVVIGAGIVGCSAVYHLAQRGWRDILVIDQGPLPRTGGSTSHAPGLIFQTNSSKTMCQIAQYTTKFYSQFGWEGQPCFYPVGGIEVATTEARWQDLHRRLGWAKAYGLKAALLSPAEVQAKVPILDPATILGGYWVEGDGIAKAVNVCAAMSQAATEMGAAKFEGGVTVTGFDIQGGKLRAVLTDKGRIETGQALICAGIWGPKVAKLAGESVPLTPVEHQYVITEPLAGLAGDADKEVVHPILRHQDHSMYLRQVGNRYAIGSYRHAPVLVEPDAIKSPAQAKVMPSIHDFTPDDFTASHAEGVRLFPALAGLNFEYSINGMFSFTPDAGCVVGQSQKSAGLWIAEAVWVTHGGGVGKVVADLMSDGASDWDTRQLDMHRFHSFAHSPAYVRERGAQQYREVYDIIHPKQQMGSPRNLRLSPWHSRLVEQNAHFFEGVGWERPQWIAANARLLEEYSVPQRTGWAAESWSPIEGAEHQATRQRVALFDLTAFTKIEVAGPGSLAFLEHLCANKIDRPLGKVVYTALLNHKGGIVCDLTVTRTAADSFLVLTGGGVGMHDLAWLRQHAPSDGSVTITDVTSRYAALGLWGPRARDVLQSVTEADVSNRAFPYFSAQTLYIGVIPVLAVRVSYAGELGWELYCPTEYGLGLWDALWAAGQPHGLIAAGGGAFDSLRLEKGYRLWGADIHTEYNPYEAGLEWAVRFDKGDFLGRDALLHSKTQGISRKLCCLTLDDPSAVALGYEPILWGEEALGYVTSANYGYSVGKYILYGYLPLEFVAPGTQVDIEYFGKRYTATVCAEPLYDAGMMKLKG